MATTTKVEIFRDVFEAALTDIAARTEPPQQRCLILSGGVDTCAILAAARKLGISFQAAITVITGDDSPDKGYAEAAASQHAGTVLLDEQQHHHLMCISSKDLVQDYLPKCIETLHCFDGMTLRNSLVVAAAFRKVKELGCKHAIVGDGADELFGGYSFMWGSADDPDAWKQKRDSMCQKWTFATAALAEAYGIEAYSPFMAKSVVDWALTETQRSDCIGTRRIQLLYGGEALEHETGKLILRQAYETVASWRRKDPIEVGSGVTVIGHDPYWKDIVSDEEFDFEAKELLSRGFEIKNKEHIVNFRVFMEVFGKNGERLPTKKRLLYQLARVVLDVALRLEIRHFAISAGRGRRKEVNT